MVGPQAKRAAVAVLMTEREGWEVNCERVYRIYRDAGLAVRRRKRKRIGLFERKPLPKPTTAN